MRRSEHGGAMLVVMLVVTTLLAGASTLLAITLRATRDSATQLDAARAQHCAEAGIAAVRAQVAANRGLWNASLCSPAEEPCAEAPWIAAVDHELDAPAVPSDPPDFQVLLRDNDDEAPGPNNLDVDADATVYIVATCLKYPDMPVTISELVHWNAGALERRLWLVSAR